MGKTKQEKKDEMADLKKEVDITEHKIPLEQLIDKLHSNLETVGLKICKFNSVKWARTR